MNIFSESKEETVKIEEIEDNVDKFFDKFSKNSLGVKLIDRLKTLNQNTHFECIVFVRSLLNSAFSLATIPTTNDGKIIKILSYILTIPSFLDTFLTFYIYYSQPRFLVIIFILLSVTKEVLATVLLMFKFYNESKLYIFIAINFILSLLVFDFSFCWILNQIIKRNENEEKIEKVETTVEV